jgi:exopolysaccharide production protein ExoZ
MRAKSAPYADATTGPRRTRFATIQVYRGLAALAVTLMHASIATGNFHGPVPPLFATIFGFGFLGVDFFFVLSGFIILTSHFDDSKSLTAALRYARKRILRIYPPFWLISIGLLGAYWLLPDLSRAPDRHIGILKSLFLLPTSGEPALVVAWTLVYEMLFYTIFLIFFVSGRLLALVVALWVAAVAVARTVGGTAAAASPLAAHLLDPLILEFVAGMCAAWAARNLVVRGGHVLAAGLLLFVAAVFEGMHLHRVGFAPALALVVLGSVLIERSGSLKMPRAAVLLGDASYALYLIHVPVIAVSARALAHTKLIDTWWIFLAANVAVALAAGLAFHLLVEKPFGRLLR